MALTLRPGEALLAEVACPGAPRFRIAVGRAEAGGTGAYGRDPVSEHLAQAGTLPSQDLVCLMLALTRPGQLVVDVGSHLGQFTLAASAAGRRAVAIDASARNVALLRASIEANGFDADANFAAASDRPGELRFNEAGPYGSVSEGQHGRVVPAVRVGDLLASRPGPAGFVKIDVEGFEVEALAGMADWLAGNGFPPLLYESHIHCHAARGRSVAALREAVQRIGYDRQYLATPPLLVPLRPDDPQPMVVGDVLATRGPVAVPAGWSLAQGFTVPAFADLLRADAASYAGHPEVLASLGRSLHASRHPILSDGRIRFLLGEMGRHPDAEVRAAFAQWPVAGAFSLHRLRRMGGLCLGFVKRAFFRRAG